MRNQTALLNGDLVSVDAPTAATLAPAVRASVLQVGSLELELHAGTEESAEFFLTTTGTTPTRDLRLRGGQTLRTGHLGGDPAAGQAFVVEVGADRLFGSAAPSMSLEALAAALSEAGISRGPRGPRLAPRGKVGWSPRRTHSAFQTVDPQTANGFLMDIRRIRAEDAAKQKPKGARVRGGHLSRSVSASSVHVVLETSDFVVYGIPTQGADLDSLAGAMAEVRVDRS
ncbi:hypothetical protein ACQP1U_05910 [Actinomycetota bacterium]